MIHRKYTRKRLLISIGCISVLLLLMLAFPVLSYFFKVFFVDPISEKASIQSVKAQVMQLPTVHLDSIHPWEGDSLVVLSIKNQGSVQFWYTAGGVPQISTITPLHNQPLNTEFLCEKRSLLGKRELAYTTELVITKNSPLGKLFPFEVKTIHDLVAHYQAIVRIVGTFPKQTATTMITDYQGTYSLVMNPDPKYSFTEPNNSAVTCYYYLPSTE